MNLAKRLLILSCTQRKQNSSKLLPALERYDGPTFRVLRKFFRENPNQFDELDVFILSAKHGLIPGGQLIDYYDWKMSSDRAKELRNGVHQEFSKLLKSNYSDVCLAVSSIYLDVLQARESLITPTVSITITNGPQGKKLTQLKKWLWHIEVENASYRENIKPTGTARIRGVELELSPTQVIELAQTALREDGKGADRFREWYVQIDSHQISPKWLVSKLTGISVSDFTSGEARRALGRLGLRSYRLNTEIGDEAGDS